MSNAKPKSNFVDLYRLLELAPLESDRAEIEAAVRKVAATAKQAGDSAVANRAARLIALAQKHLLDPQRKTAYDRHWQTRQEQQAEQLSASDRDARKPVQPGREADWNWELFEGTLPAGDPCEAFDLAHFCELAADQPVTDLEADFQKLQALLGAAAEEPTPSGSQAPASSPAQVATLSRSEKRTSAGVATASPGARAVQSEVAAQGVAGQPPIPAGTKPKSLATKIRRKRERSLLWTALGILLSAAIVLGTIFVLVNQTQEQPAADPIAANTSPTNTPTAPQTTDQPAASSTPRRSGLPQVPGAESLDPAMQQATEDPTANGSSNSGNAAQPQPATPAAEPPMTMSEPEPGVPTDTPNTNPGPPPTAPMETASPTLTDADKTRWQSLMLDIREQLGKQAYPQANTGLTEAESLAITEAQQDQLIRLKTVAALAEDAFRALTDAIGDLQGGETFQIGSRTAAFVEGDETGVVIRYEGQNKRYPLMDLPIGVFEGLVDLKLDLEAQNAQARKAAFIFLHPANSDLSLQKARQWMQAAVEAGVVPEPTILVFDDDYAL